MRGRYPTQPPPTARRAHTLTYSKSFSFRCRRFDRISTSPASSLYVMTTRLSKGAKFFIAAWTARYIFRFEAPIVRRRLLPFSRHISPQDAGGESCSPQRGRCRLHVSSLCSLPLLALMIAASAPAAQVGMLQITDRSRAT